MRPQFFVPLITLLRNAALNAMKYKSELALVRSQNVDITKFETQLDEFKTAFGRNWRLASEGFEEAIKRIDDAIKDLEKNQGSPAQVSQQFAPGQRQGRRSDDQEAHTWQPDDGGKVCGVAGEHDIG